MRSAPVIIVQLIHIEGPLKGAIQEFNEEEIFIGRNPTCHVQFPKDQTTISRMHARIVREGNRFKMVNQCPNGTFINGKRVEEAYLKNGDVLTISEGGPKVSFLTEMKEAGDILSTPQPTTQPDPPVRQTPIEPPPQQKPADIPVQQKPIAPQKPEVPPVQQKPLEPQKQAAAQEISIQKIKVPLIIQHGPTLRSYNQLPITIGKASECDFILDIPAILDHHAQFFFHENKYWVKDLTGQQAVSINGQAIKMQAPLNPEDRLKLSTSGPSFKFLGGGRLAEIEEQIQEEPGRNTQADKPDKYKGAFSAKNQADKVLKGAKSMFGKILKH